MGQMTEHDHMQLALATAAEIEAAPGATRTVAAGGFRGRLQDILTWLRQQNIPWQKIFASLPAILAALSAGDWMAVIQAVANIFGISPSTAPQA